MEILLLLGLIVVVVVVLIGVFSSDTSSTSNSGAAPMSQNNVPKLSPEERLIDIDEFLAKYPTFYVMYGRTYSDEPMEGQYDSLYTTREKVERAIQGLLQYKSVQPNLSPKYAPQLRVEQGNAEGLRKHVSKKSGSVYMSSRLDPVVNTSGSGYSLMATIADYKYEVVLDKEKFNEAVANLRRSFS